MHLCKPNYQNLIQDVKCYALSRVNFNLDIQWRLQVTVSTHITQAQSIRNTAFRNAMSSLECMHIYSKWLQKVCRRSAVVGRNHLNVVKTSWYSYRLESNLDSYKWVNSVNYNLQMEYLTMSLYQQGECFPRQWAGFRKKI